MKPEDVPKLCTYNKERKEWHCNKCGSVIQAKEQVKSLHMSPNSGMPLAGFGETTTVIIPYCPKCEKEPSNTGIAHYGNDEDPDVRELRIIKKIGERL